MGRDVDSIFRYLEMLPSGEMLQVPAAKIYSKTPWTRVPTASGGYFFPTCMLGGPVEEGQILGYIVDPPTDRKTTIEAPHRGEMIGFATPQIVLSGFVLWHIGFPDS